MSAADVNAPGLTDEDVAKAREMIGTWLRRDVHMPAVYEPISQHDVRRWAHYSVGDDNPLWSEPDYGRRTIWGGTIAPPTFLYTIDSGIVAPGLRGVQWIFGGSTWENHLPVRVGDTITARARLIDVKEKSGRSVPRFLEQIGEVLFTNQHDRLVSRYVGSILRIPRNRSGQGLRYRDEAAATKFERYVYTPEEIEEVRRCMVNEFRRGDQILYFEDVKPGDELPEILKGPLTLTDIVGLYAGRRTVYNVLKMAFLERERHPANVYVSPSTGIPMHPAAGHYDAEIAREVGMPGAYDQGWQRLNWAGHLLTNWCGDAGWVRRLEGRVTIPNLVGDLTRLRGTVQRCYREDGEALVDIAWAGTNQRGIRNCHGTATVRLQSRQI